jgi:hypothetical protein
MSAAMAGAAIWIAASVGIFKSFAVPRASSSSRLGATQRLDFSLCRPIITPDRFIMKATVYARSLSGRVLLWWAKLSRCGCSRR